MSAAPDTVPDNAAWRMYLLLALFDRRDGTYISRLVQSAREAYEREDVESGAYDEFDALWNRLSSRERLALVGEVAPDETQGEEGPYDGGCDAGAERGRINPAASRERQDD